MEGQSTFQEERRAGSAHDRPRALPRGSPEAPLPQAHRRPAGRDLRLDFFRGLALLFIFVDHIPLSVVWNFTLRAVAFCDAAEVFIFISGFTAALVYGRILERQGVLPASARVYRRVWQLYVAHVFIFAIYTALVTNALGMGGPAFVQEMGEGNFLRHPGATVSEMLLLSFQPGLLAILPLYILLLSAFPIVLLLLRRHPLLALLPSIALYLLAHRFGWTPHLYPDHHPWFFNPLAWQLMFVGGAVCGHLYASGQPILPNRAWIVALAGAVALIGAVVSVSHVLHSVFETMPPLWPSAPWDSEIDKTNLALLRVVNFAAIAIVATWLVRRDAAFLSGRLARPLILCGQNSLYIFCLSILLSTVGYFILERITDRLRMQLAVTAAGAAIMIGAAFFIAWYKRLGRDDASRPAAAVTE